MLRLAQETTNENKKGKKTHLSHSPSPPPTTKRVKCIKIRAKDVVAGYSESSFAAGKSVSNTSLSHLVLDTAPHGSSKETLRHLNHLYMSSLSLSRVNPSLARQLSSSLHSMAANAGIVFHSSISQRYVERFSLCFILFYFLAIKAGRCLSFSPRPSNPFPNLSPLSLSFPSLLSPILSSSIFLPSHFIFF